MYMTVSWAFAVNIPAITEEYLVVFLACYSLGWAIDLE